MHTFLPFALRLACISALLIRIEDVNAAAQALRAMVDVTLCGGTRHMPQQFLDGEEIDAVLGEPGGEAVAIVHFAAALHLPGIDESPGRKERMTRRLIPVM
jgi:hypothetical protein